MEYIVSLGNQDISDRTEPTNPGLSLLVVLYVQEHPGRRAVFVHGEKQL